MIPCHDSVSAIESSACLVFWMACESKTFKDKTRGWRIRNYPIMPQVGRAIKTSLSFNCDGHNRYNGL